MIEKKKEKKKEGGEGKTVFPPPPKYRIELLSSQNEKKIMRNCPPRENLEREGGRERLEERKGGGTAAERERVW